jgi:hypothetical protein
MLLWTALLLTLYFGNALLDQCVLNLFYQLINPCRASLMAENYYSPIECMSIP